jgi:hypothetical protein
MAWSLVCPASRGIGFHLTRHLLQTTKIPVVATAREDVTGVKKSILEDLKDVESDRLTVLEVDVTGKFLFWESFYRNRSWLNNVQTKIPLLLLQKRQNSYFLKRTTTFISPSLSRGFFIQKNLPLSSTTHNWPSTLIFLFFLIATIW